MNRIGTGAPQWVVNALFDPHWNTNERTSYAELLRERVEPLHLALAGTASAAELAAFSAAADDLAQSLSRWDGFDQTSRAANGDIARAIVEQASKLSASWIKGAADAQWVDLIPRVWRLAQEVVLDLEGAVSGHPLLVRSQWALAGEGASQVHDASTGLARWWRTELAAALGDFKDLRELASAEGPEDWRKDLRAALTAWDALQVPPGGELARLGASLQQLDVLLASSGPARVAGQPDPIDAVLQRIEVAMRALDGIYIAARDALGKAAPRPDAPQPPKQDPDAPSVARPDGAARSLLEPMRELGRLLLVARDTAVSVVVRHDAERPAGGGLSTWWQRQIDADGRAIRANGLAQQPLQDLAGLLADLEAKLRLPALTDKEAANLLANIAAKADAALRSLESPRVRRPDPALLSLLRAKIIAALGVASARVSSRYDAKPGGIWVTPQAHPEPIELGGRAAPVVLGIHRDDPVWKPAERPGGEPGSPGIGTHRPPTLGDPPGLGTPGGAGEPHDPLKLPETGDPERTGTPETGKPPGGETGPPPGSEGFTKGPEHHERGV